MNTLFGIPMSTLTLVLVVAFAVCAAAVSALAIRNRVFLRIGVRNVARRRSRTVLIVIGLMLGTALISAALNTGDTLAHTVRSSVLTSLGRTDEVIAVTAVRSDQFRVGTVVDYFDERKLQDVRAAAADSKRVAAIAPAIVETVAIQDVTSRRTEAQVGLFATEPDSMQGFGAITRDGGGSASLADLASGEVYLNAKAAEKLGAHAGDELRVFAAGQLSSARVSAIVRYDGTGTDGAAVLMPLGSAQALVGKPGSIDYILVSNAGGVGATDDVVAALKPVVTALGLEIDPAKQDALRTADEVGNSMMLTFTTFGTFSIAAGILLIFLIFVMLAAERKTEMGISRALGTQRENLVQTFLFDGIAYDLAAAAVGALLGVGVAYVMVIIMAAAFANVGFQLQHDLRPQSLIVAYTLGVLLTLAVVTVSAWQVSVLNIVRAIRNIPDPALRGHGSGRLLVGAIAWVLGGLLIYAGYSGRQAATFHLGVSLLFIGGIPMLRATRLPDRAAYSLPGAALTAWWLLPSFVTEGLLPPLSRDFTIFVTGGIMVVLGATWVLMYNSDLILRAVMAVFGRVRWLAPVLKAAIAYPLKSRFRTGVTLAMFTLVVFTLVTMATTISSVNGVIDDRQAFSGGYDLRAMTAPISPIADLKQAITTSGLDASAYESTAATSMVPLKMRQATGSDGEFHDYVLRGLDDAFLRDNGYEFALTAPGYGSAREVWQALADDPDLAVIDSQIVPRRTNYNGAGDTLDFHVSGFDLEDKRLPDLRIDVRDEETGKVRTVKVIGVLKDTASIVMFGVFTSQRSAVAAYGVRAAPIMHFIRLAPGVDASAAADSLESAFLTNGMQVNVMQDDLDDLLMIQHAFTYILEGFMGLGLIVGVAALGVISARAVVERRQEIGVLRSLGFQRVMVQIAFLIESSFISLLGIALGTVLGLIVAFNVVLDYRTTPGWGNMAFSVPWLTLAVVFVAVYAGSVFATLIPAGQAARVRPAEALRYE